MDEIESQIIQLMRDRPEGMEALEVRNEIMQRFGNEYPVKRIRRKLDAMCEYAWLTKSTVKKDGRRGPESNLYTIVNEEGI